MALCATAQDLTGQWWWCPSAQHMCMADENLGGESVQWQTPVARSKDLPVQVLPNHTALQLLNM